VATASDRNEQIIRPRKLHGANDIGNPGTAGDQTRMFIDAGVPDTSRRVITGVGWQDNLAAEIAPESIYEFLVNDNAAALLQQRGYHVLFPPPSKMRSLPGIS
jgi:hypothetical protein